MSCLPITLIGDNLGLRHRNLNSLVAECYKQHVPFREIQDLPENTPLDRLFKIDLASKLRNVDYILQNLKDEDMLYVSRALKAKWILDREYQNIINPVYLEHDLYPHMITTAVSKVKNWLYLNLKDSERCAEFYKYYSDANFDYAIKFLGRCSVDFMNVTPNILEKISPHYFKVLCEKCPQVAKIYFDNILINDKLKICFLDNQFDYFRSLKVVLKLDPDIFFAITEKYFDVTYGRALTKYIMTRHRDRFDKKPELYASRLLNMQAVAECLTSEECKELVLKLARASYISYSVDYQFVEPLIKRLPLKERSAFKKRVFVEKEVGELVENWPYDIPSLPPRNEYQSHIFDDREYRNFNLCDVQFCSVQDYSCDDYQLRCQQSLRLESCRAACPNMRTNLDRLFDEYRFVSYERTLFELRKKIKEDSSSQNRQYMMLVLVSKSGGQTELLTSLLELLEQHLNEPVHVRATVVRSLVKRAAVWRLPQRAWEAMLRFARGLGLDGATPEADCREGLHAVVIRSLLESGTCEPAIRDAFLKDFSHLDEYSTNVGERKILREKLPLVLLSAAETELDTKRQVELLSSLLDMLRKYEMDIEKSPLIPAVAALSKRDSSAAEYILLRLFNAKLARRTLFRENFPLVQTDASYLNALRHDTSVISVNKFIELVEKKEIHPEQFLRKIAVYFTEPQGMMELFRTQLRERVLRNPNVGTSIARPLALLQGASLDYLQTLDVKNESVARLASAIKANIHMGRPKLEINKIELSAVGSKAVANKVLVCRSVAVENYIKILLNWKRTVRVALVLSERIGKEADVFASAATLRPTATLKAIVKYLRRRGDDFDPRVWEIFKQFMNNIDLCTEKRVHIRESLKKLNKIPSIIKPAYCVMLFKALKNNYYFDAVTVLSEMEILLPRIDENFLEQEQLDFLRKFKNEDCKRQNELTNTLYLRVSIKFLLLCKSDETQKNRWEKINGPLFKCLETFLHEPKQQFMNMFDVILLSLQYHKVFFDDGYVSPLPVLENVVSWMRQRLPIEIHFNKYVCIHLTMLYLKSVRQCVKSQPEVFKNEKRKLSEGISIVGHVFGKNIAQEIRQLKENYFESVIEMYRTGIAEYFSTYFEYDVTKFKFIKAVVEGILQASVGDEVRIALYIIRDECSYFDQTDVNTLMDTMKNITDEKFKYFFYA